MVGRFKTFLAMAALSSILLVVLFACGPEVIAEGGAVEGVATPDAVPAPTPLPSDTPTPALAPPLVPQLSLVFDGDSAAAVDSELVRIDFTVTNWSPSPASDVTLAFEVDAPASFALAHAVSGTCEVSTCDLGSFDGNQSVSGYVVVGAGLGSDSEINVGADLSWLSPNLNTRHSYAQAIVTLAGYGRVEDLEALIWATEVGTSIGSCGESVQVASESVQRSFGPSLHSFAKSDGEKQWKASGVNFNYPVVAGSSVNVHAAEFQSDADYIRSYDALDGTLNWQRILTGNTRGPAAVYGGSVFYTVNHRGGSPVQHYLMSLDASTGLLNWQYHMDQWISTAAVEYGGNIYFASYNGSSYLYAIDPTTGELSRRYETPGKSYDEPLIADDSAYIVTASGRLYSMDLSTGMINWEYRPKGRVSGTPLLSDGNVYIRIRDDEVREYRSLHALDAATGSLQWQYQTGRELLQPAASNGRVFVPTWESVVALDAMTGRPKSLILFHTICAPLTIADGVMYGTARNQNEPIVFAIRID